MAALDACCDNNEGFMYDRPGCESGCAGDEPHVNLLKSTAGAVVAEEEGSANDSADGDGAKAAAQCTYPPLHPKLRYPDRW